MKTSPNHQQRLVSFWAVRPVVVGFARGIKQNWGALRKGEGPCGRASSGAGCPAQDMELCDLPGRADDRDLYACGGARGHAFSSGELVLTTANG